MSNSSGDMSHRIFETKDANPSRNVVLSAWLSVAISSATPLPTHDAYPPVMSRRKDQK
jgi:hypothetical protein